MASGRTRYQKGRCYGAPRCRCREFAKGVSEGQGACASPDESRGKLEVRWEYISVTVPVVIVYHKFVTRAYVNG